MEHILEDEDAPASCSKDYSCSPREFMCCTNAQVNPADAHPFFVLYRPVLDPHKKGRYLKLGHSKNRTHTAHAAYKRLCPDTV